MKLCLTLLPVDFKARMLFVPFFCWPLVGFYWCCVVGQYVCVYSRLKWGTGIIYRLLSTGAIKPKLFSSFSVSYCTHCSLLLMPGLPHSKSISPWFGSSCSCCRKFWSSVTLSEYEPRSNKGWRSIIPFNVTKFTRRRDVLIKLWNRSEGVWVVMLQCDMNNEVKDVNSTLNEWLWWLCTFVFVQFVLLHLHFEVFSDARLFPLC